MGMPERKAERKPCVSMGHATVAGVKPGRPWENQDACLMISVPENKLLAGVFDGHGPNGQKASARVKEIVTSTAAQFLGNVTNGEQAKVGFGTLCDHLQSLLDDEGLCAFSGTTANFALVDLVAETVIFANVGDSTGVLFDRQAITFVTKDHKIDDEATERIKAAGGEVRVEGVQRVFFPGKVLPGLALARALGDTKASKIGVICQPDVSDVLPFKDGGLLLCSDGVWDVVSHAQAAEESLRAKDGQAAAVGLAQAAVARWPENMHRDDITVLTLLAAP